MPVISKQTATSNTKKQKSNSVLDRIKPMEFDENEGISIILYGRSGSGKTTLWSTFPAPILSIVCSGGIKSGELRSIDTAANRKRVQTVVLENSMEIRELCEYQQETQKFKTIVLDHVTGFQDLVLKEILGLQEIPAQKSWGLATQQQYGQVALQCKEHFQSLLSCKTSANVIFVGQEREKEVPEGSELLKPSVFVALTPSLAGWLMPACDYVCQTCLLPKEETYKVTINGKEQTKTRKAQGVRYCLRVGPHDVFATKFRKPMDGNDLPELLENPSYNKIMELIRDD